MIKKITFTIFLFTFAMLTAANAQTDVSTEKQAAIKELITLISTDNKAEDFVYAMSTQMEALRKETIKTVLDERTDLTPAERRSMEESSIKETGDKVKRFQERLLQKLDFNAMMEEITAASYEKHYTLDEIRDLIAFYKTPTGQKTLKLMTTIMTETMVSVQEKLLPKIPQILKELQDEDRREIEKQIEAKKPRNNKRTS